MICDGLISVSSPTDKKLILHIPSRFRTRTEVILSIHTGSSSRPPCFRDTLQAALANLHLGPFWTRRSDDSLRNHGVP
jgi:hypothetical protein